MTCRLCGKRPARRACPALGHDICSVCCGTKRLVEIRCPPDCPYLVSARDHPPAAAVRQHQRDVAFVVEVVRGLNDRQSRIFLLVAAFLARYKAPELQPLVDDDVAEAAAALAATFETASRGVIYEHQAASPPAERLLAALHGALEEAGREQGAAFERDCAAVLRRVQETVAGLHTREPGHRRAFLEILDRIIRKEPDAPAADGPRLIVP
jgi:hypothetical protein